jgi:hypothetical protein
MNCEGAGRGGKRGSERGGGFMVSSEREDSVGSSDVSCVRSARTGVKGLMNGPGGKFGALEVDELAGALKVFARLRCFFCEGSFF